MASEHEEAARAALLADWRQRLDNQAKADRALFMHVSDLEPGVLVIEELQQQLAQAREEVEKGNAAIQENVKLRQEIEFLHIVIDDRVAERYDLRADRAAMRALLERVRNTHLSYVNEVQVASLWPKLAEDISAFLAEHPQ